MRKHVQRRSQASRRPDADQDAERNGNHGEAQRIMLHVDHVGVGVFAGLLGHHRPAQSLHRFIRPQHWDLVLPTWSLYSLVTETRELAPCSTKLFTSSLDVMSWPVAYWEPADATRRPDSSTTKASRSRSAASRSFLTR